MANSVVTSAEPPADISGNGTPSTGRSPRTTAMLTNACPRIQTMMALTVIRARLSVDALMIRTNEIARTMNRARTIIAPSRPSSSPMMAKMKSLSASGSQDHFAFELPRPTPNSPPDASAHHPWSVCQHSPLKSASVLQPLCQARMRFERALENDIARAPSATTIVGMTSRRSRTPAKNSAPSTMATRMMTVPRSPPNRTSAIAAPATMPIGRTSSRQSSRTSIFFARITPSQTTRATFTSSDGWNENVPSSIQLRFPLCSMPRLVAMTRNCSAIAMIIARPAHFRQNTAGSRAATSMSGMPRSAKSPWRRNPVKKSSVAL